MANRAIDGKELIARARKSSRTLGVRQDNLRLWLSNHRHLQQVIETIDRLRDLSEPLKPEEVMRLKIVVDSKLKLINKYLPDLRPAEVPGAANIDQSLTIKLVKYQKENPPIEINPHVPGFMAEDGNNDT